MNIDVYTHMLSTGDQGNMWKQQSIDIDFASSKAYIEFEGTIEHSGGPHSRVAGEMAIDDIILTQRSSCSDLDSMFTNCVIIR